MIAVNEEFYCERCTFRTINGNAIVANEMELRHTIFETFGPNLTIMYYIYKFEGERPTWDSLEKTYNSILFKSITKSERCRVAANLTNRMYKEDNISRGHCVLTENDEVTYMEMPENGSVLCIHEDLHNGIIPRTQ